MLVRLRRTDGAAGTLAKGEENMPHLPNLVGVAVLVSGIFAVGPTAFADESRSKAICQSVDEGSPQEIGDREGHMKAVYDVTCNVVEGQPSGGVSSAKVIVEWDKSHATLIAAATSCEARAP
jgi:hypothetical protein